MLDLEEILKAEDEAVRKTGGCLAVSEEFLKELQKEKEENEQRSNKR